MNKHGFTFKTFKKRQTIIWFIKKEEWAMHLVAIQEKAAFYLLTYGFNIKRKNIKESIKSINPLS